MIKMIKSKWIEFDKVGDTGKTEIWNVLSNVRTDTFLTPRLVLPETPERVFHDIFCYLARAVLSARHQP